MNFLTLVRPISEVLPLMGTPYDGDTAALFWVPFAPVAYLGLS